MQRLQTIEQLEDQACVEVGSSLHDLVISNCDDPSVAVVEDGTVLAGGRLAVLVGRPELNESTVASHDRLVLDDKGDAAFERGADRSQRLLEEVLATVILTERRLLCVRSCDSSAARVSRLGRCDALDVFVNVLDELLLRRRIRKRREHLLDLVDGE